MEEQWKQLWRGNVRVFNSSFRGAWELCRYMYLYFHRHLGLSEG